MILSQWFHRRACILSPIHVVLPPKVRQKKRRSPAMRLKRRWELWGAADSISAFLPNVLKPFSVNIILEQIRWTNTFSKVLTFFGCLVCSSCFVLIKLWRSTVPVSKTLAPTAGLLATGIKRRQCCPSDTICTALNFVLWISWLVLQEEVERYRKVEGEGSGFRATKIPWISAALFGAPWGSHGWSLRSFAEAEAGGWSRDSSAVTWKAVDLIL